MPQFDDDLVQLSLPKMCQGYLPENSLLGNIDTVAAHETGITGMMLYLDCEFTQLSPAAKLISLAFVADDGREFYIELLDSWSIEDCSDLVIDIVLPQLWGGAYAMPVLAARDTILAFLEGFTEMVEIVTDAPHFDWELFYQLTYSHGHWPRNVRNWPTDATTLDAVNDGSPLPHHALLDARIIASMSGQRMCRLYRSQVTKPKTFGARTLRAPMPRISKSLPPHRVRRLQHQF